MLESQDHSIEIDLFDKQILFYLAKGTQTVDLPQYIPISLNAIESRKLNLKELLNSRRNRYRFSSRSKKNRFVVLILQKKPPKDLIWGFSVHVVYYSLNAFQPRAFKQF
jgi:hypothetical protein